MKQSTTLNQLSRFVLRPSQWDATAEAWSKVLPSDAPGSHLDFLKAEVASGLAKVCTLHRDGAKVGYLVFAATDACELHILACFGDATGGNLVTEFLPFFESLARQCECTSIRFHTMRPGLIRRAQAQGFRVSEIIMRKDVA